MSVLPTTGAASRPILLTGLSLLFAGIAVFYLSRRMNNQARELDEQ